MVTAVEEPASISIILNVKFWEEPQGLGEGGREGTGLNYVGK